MKNKTKYIINSIMFVILLTSLFLLNIIRKPEEVSVSERRKLSGYPTLTIKNMLNGKFTEEFEKYTKDQFIQRDQFRSIKAFIHFNIYRQKDNNKIYIADGSVIKIEYPLNESSVLNAANKFNSLYEMYFEGMNVWYSVIPDKNYYTAQNHGYPSIDYTKMFKLLNDNVKNMEYIDITDCLTINDFYKTDIHWRQEKLGRVLDKLALDIGFSQNINLNSYEENAMYPFYGVYYGQSALAMPPETLIYLNNESMKNTKVHYYDTNTNGSIYIPEKFSDIDPYNLYLSGPAALITIENNNAQTNKELILIRDSYGSSLAPLLTEEYSKITLVDLRYITTEYLGKVLSFSNQDILIMLNTQVLNNSYMLR